MSLYRAIFGTNPFSATLLDMLGASESGVPRYRDCFLNEEGSKIIIYTRTGGGNRDYYESEQCCRDNYPEDFEEGRKVPQGPWNSDLRAIPGYLHDHDDDYDSTYAHFYYAVPEPFKAQVELLKNLGAVTDPAARWQSVLDGLKTRDVSNPEVQRAIAIGEKIMSEISKAVHP